LDYRSCRLVDAQNAEAIAFGRLSRVWMCATVYHDVAIGRTTALVAAFVDNLGVHRCADPRLHVLPLGLAHSAEDTHKHLV